MVSGSGFLRTLTALAAFAAATPALFAIGPPQLRAGGASASFTDRYGTPMGTILSASQERAVAVPLDRVSPYFLQAILAAEDARFYRHGAVDAAALAHAAWRNAACLCNAGGASTITMQLARMTLHPGQGLRGKFVQMWDAERIEAGSSKRTILEAYVNRVAMGGNVYGVEAAAREYFGVPATDLDLAQASLLAGIPNDPAHLQPRAFWRSARLRQRYVLARMVANGDVAPSLAANAARETVHVRPADADLADAQQLLFTLARTQPQTAAPIRTSIDLPLQRFVQAQARDVVTALSDHNVTQAAALVIDNATGEVLAYLGSLDYFDDAYLGRNDGVQSLRQPGSTLKPFLYEAALERGTVTPRTVLADVPASYAIPNGQVYSPEDYSRTFLGPVSVRTALANSLNVPAVRVLSQFGVPAFLDRLRALGFTHLQRAPEYYGLGLTLGAGEVSLWDLAHAYVTLARNGSAIPLRTIAGASPPHAAPIGRAADWAYVTDILSDRYARSRSYGIGSVIDMPFPAAVKTGTSSGYRDTWTVGYTPEFTVAVWVGNFTGAPMTHVAGVSGAGPLWNRIMLHLYERRHAPAFAPVHVEGEAAQYVRAAASRRAFDEWRARQGATTGALRILFPHDGDVFEDALAPNDPARAQQSIEMRISRPRGANVTWTLNGAALARSPADAYYWTVRPGRWNLAVTSGGVTSRAEFYVIARPGRFKRGFSPVR